MDVWSDRAGEERRGGGRWRGGLVSTYPQPSARGIRLGGGEEGEEEEGR